MAVIVTEVVVDGGRTVGVFQFLIKNKPGHTSSPTRSAPPPRPMINIFDSYMIIYDEIPEMMILYMRIWFWNIFLDFQKKKNIFRTYFEKSEKKISKKFLIFFVKKVENVEKKSRKK